MSGARVLHVFKYFRPRFTGEGVFMERLAPVFARLRPDVRHDILVTATPEPSCTPTLPGLERVQYLARSSTGASQGELVAWLARNGGRYAVVHHHTHVDRTFLGALLLKLTGRRLVLSATLDDSVAGLLATYRPALRPLVRRLFGLIDVFVSISPKLFEETRPFVPARKSQRVAMGVPIPEPDERDPQPPRAALGIAPDATMLVCVGGICERKDQLFLLRQMPAVVEQDRRAVLVLVGPTLEPAYRAQLDAFVAEHGLEAHVRFAGHASEPWDFYKAADIFVFASREEGFGTVVIEAMAHGLPVVARRLPGVNDGFVAQGRTGFLFTDAAGFQAQLGVLLHDRHLRRRLGSRARAVARDRFDISGVAAQYLALYGYPASGR